MDKKKFMKPTSMMTVWCQISSNNQGLKELELQKMKSSGVGPYDGVNKNKGDTSKRVSVKRRRTSKKDNVKSIVLETRSSPRTFYNSISTLKPNQKACLEQIGFGNFVEFKVDGIPSKLGLYVVDKFDAKKMEMKLAEGDIKLRIRKSNSADMNFKLNFIVLFTSVMGQFKPKGFCDLKILDYIRPDIDLANINWCEYFLRCLRSCKEEWTKSKKIFFRGPLTFLTRPPTVVWTSELLREREDEELNSGGFGFGEIKGLFVEQEDPLPDNIKGFFWKLNKHINSVIKEKIGFEKTLDAAEYMFPGKLEGFFERYVDALKYQGCRKEGSGNANISDENKAADAQADGQNNEEDNNILGDIGMDQGRVVDNIRVTSLRDKHAYVDMDQEGTVDDNILGSPTLYNMGPETQSLANKLVDKLSNENRFGSPSLYNMGPETQEEVLRSVDDVDATIKRRKWVDMSDIPSFSLGATQDFALLDEDVVTPEANTHAPNLASKISNQLTLRPIPLRVCPPGAKNLLSECSYQRLLW
nr:hypothetical protein [Tanacetum cinerariifolium]